MNFLWVCIFGTYDLPFNYTITDIELVFNVFCHEGHAGGELCNLSWGLFASAFSKRNFSPFPSELDFFSGLLQKLFFRVLYRAPSPTRLSWIMSHSLTRQVLLEGRVCFAKLCQSREKMKKTEQRNDTSQTIPLNNTPQIVKYPHSRTKVLRQFTKTNAFELTIEFCIWTKTSF